jgi:integral membrane sensor domain MASE1
VIGTLSDEIFAPFWPPNVVLFCALLFAPVRQWWVYLAAVLPAHIIAELSVGMPWPQLAVAYATNVILALLVAVMGKSILGEPPWFETPQKAGDHGRAR